MASGELQEIMALLQQRAKARQGQVLTWIERRLSYDDLGMAFENLDGVTLREDINAGGVPGLWVEARNADTARTLLFLHGGGYCQGSPHSHRGLAAELSRACRARVLLLNYRLAPEYTFPAPVEDTLAAYRWLLDQGTDPAQLCVAGDSAGGGLTVAALVSFRDAGLPMPAAGVCLSPWTDMDAVGRSMDTNKGIDPMIARAGILEFARTYLDGADHASPLATPIHAELDGLPPLFIQVGSIETLLDDSTRLEVAAKEAGVDVTLEVWDDMPHVWHMFAPKLPEAVRAIKKIGSFVETQLNAIS